MWRSEVTCITSLISHKVDSFFGGGGGSPSVHFFFQFAAQHNNTVLNIKLAYVHSDHFKSFQCIQKCYIIFCHFLFFQFQLFFWPGQLLVQHLINSVDSKNLNSTVTCWVVLCLHSKRLHNMTVSSSVSCTDTVVIVVEMMNGKSTLCKTALHSSQNYQLLDYWYEMHSRQYNQLHTCSILKQSTAYLGNSLSYEMFLIIVLECTDDPQI